MFFWKGHGLGNIQFLPLPQHTNQTNHQILYLLHYKHILSESTFLSHLHHIPVQALINTLAAEIIDLISNLNIF